MYICSALLDWYTFKLFVGILLRYHLHIKAELQMDLILILAEHGYPPVPQDDVFKEIFEQAENFKKYEKAESEEKSDDIENLALQLNMIAAFTAESPSKKTSTKSSNKKVVEAKLIPSGSVLDDVEADDDVRRLIHNMMELYEGTTIMNIVLECQREFQEKYFSMGGNEWRHLIRDYVRMVTELPELQETEVFRFTMAG